MFIIGGGVILNSSAAKKNFTSKRVARVYVSRRQRHRSASSTMALGPLRHSAPGPCRRWGGGALFLYVSLTFSRVYVLLRKTRWRRHSEDVISFSPSSPHLGGALPSSEGVWRHVSSGSRRIMSMVVFGGSGVRSSTSVCLQIGAFPSMFLFISGGCCVVRWTIGVLARRFSTV